ncbi:hypothetical protein H310_00588 [Aphanomyces invadans]|uniref:Uncharacterized protein n=1 Tax=Aphanomyces invadans TaxID=157072 RepID=A0A024UX26_9STRA|nr:hypothetical protein H310_00588 [Aphanomyces invadans]ETW10233.1 hypothetical protein H310_00588 [Aphanomyces invadans]|eukprot:XP_008861644.1 hypothetical protein H310_00588 [Aphanomyces invadans]
MTEVYGAELQHPVFQALDITHSFATIESFESRIRHALESPKHSFQTFHDSLQVIPVQAIPLHLTMTLQDLFASLQKLKMQFRSFTANRGLHIDNATFARWRAKLEDAHTVEKSYLQTITQLQTHVMELQHQKQVANRTFEAELRSMEAKISTRLSTTELAECELMWEHERESLLNATASKIESLEQHVDDLQCQLHQTGDSLYQRERRLKYLEQVIDDRPPIPMRPATPSVVVTTGPPKVPAPLPKPAVASVEVQVDLRSPPVRPAKPKSNAELDQDMILHELDAIRKLLDRDMVEDISTSGAWDQVRSCGVLASVVSIKQRLVSSHARIKLQKFPTTPTADCPSNNQVLSARQRSQQPATPETSSLPHSMHDVLTTKANLKLTQRPKQSVLPTVQNRSKSAMRRPPVFTDGFPGNGKSGSGDRLFSLSLDHPGAPSLAILSSRERHPSRM